MEAERWQKVERLYHAALAVEESRRDDFLEGSCAGDEVLRNEVEALLACHGKAEQFMEVPALEVMARALAGDPGKQSLWLANCYFAHDSSRFRVLLPFFDA